MIERLTIELNDIKFAALVVGMASLTLGLCNVRTFAMEAEFSGNVGSNLLVAVETKPTLAFFGKRFVAALAGFFEFDVGVGDVAGADKFFE